MRNIVKYTDYKQFHATSRIIYNGQDITNNKAPDDNKTATSHRQPDQDKDPKSRAASRPRRHSIGGGF